MAAVESAHIDTVRFLTNECDYQSDVRDLFEIVRRSHMAVSRWLIDSHGTNTCASSPRAMVKSGCSVISTSEGVHGTVRHASPPPGKPQSRLRGHPQASRVPQLLQCVMQGIGKFRNIKKNSLVLLFCTLIPTSPLSFRFLAEGSGRGSQCFR